jgi:hypothetical protein
MTGSAPCSARAASDDTAEQARNAMNSRRFMVAPQSRRLYPTTSLN